MVFEASYLSITPADIQGYMAKAHFAVPGHEFKPYLG